MFIRKAACLELSPRSNAKPTKLSLLKRRPYICYDKRWHSKKSVENNNSRLVTYSS